MKTDDILSIFFSRSYEAQINNMILDDIDYVVNEYGVLNYVANVIDVPYSSYLEYVSNNPNPIEITARNITQSSSFAACECEMIDIFLKENNRGMEFVEIGKHFSNYVRSDKDGAYRKYGENQVKTAEQLGLAFEYFKHWYLNSVGYIYMQLDLADRMSLLSRNLLRDPLYSRIMVDMQKADVDLLSYMDPVKSIETKLRRYDSVKRLVEICLSECEKEGVKTFSILDSKTKLGVRRKSERIAPKRSQPIQMELPFESDMSVRAQSDRYCIERTESAAMVAEEISVYKSMPYYLAKFTSLNCYTKNDKPAPHKAIMLLAVINEIARGMIDSNIIRPTKDLKSEFNHLAAILSYDRTLFKPNFTTPFIHLEGDGFWHIIRKNSTDDTTELKLNLIDHVELDNDLFSLLQIPINCTQLKYALMGKYLNL